MKVIMIKVAIRHVQDSENQKHRSIAEAGVKIQEMDCIHRVPLKSDILFSTITFPNVNRFSTFFHC